MECTGMWLPAATCEDGESGVSVSRCSGCSDWLVIIGYQGFDVSAADAATTRAAVAAAFAQRRNLA